MARTVTLRIPENISPLPRPGRAPGRDAGLHRPGADGFRSSGSSWPPAPRRRGGLSVAARRAIGRGGSPTSAATSAATALRVEVIRPRCAGGLGRTVVQPGQVQAFDRAQLYAKVSGYLVRQKVDIGDAVKKGQVLAEVDAPELFKARDQARAAVGQMRGKIKQMEARVLTARADRETAAAAVEQAKAGIANSPPTASTARRSSIGSPSWPSATPSSSGWSTSSRSSSTPPWAPRPRRTRP